MHKLEFKNRPTDWQKILCMASVISWAACPDPRSENSCAQHEGWRALCTKAEGLCAWRLCALWFFEPCSNGNVLPEKVVSDTVKIIQATFEEIHPCCGNQPIIRKCLEETTLDPLACSIKKRLWNDFRGSSVIIFQINASKTWYGHGTINCFDAAQVEEFFRSEEITLTWTTTLGKAPVITYACSGPESTAFGQVDVDILVHSATNTWLATLKAWLDPATNPLVVKFEWNAIQTGKGIPYQRNPTIQRFNFSKIQTKRRPSSETFLKLTPLHGLECKQLTFPIKNVKLSYQWTPICLFNLDKKLSEQLQCLQNP